MTEKGATNGGVVVNQDEEDVVLVDLEKLTIGEIELAEELAGKPISDLFEPGKPVGKLLRAVAVALRRRSNPEYSWEQAGRLRVFIQPSTPVPPTSGRGSSTKSRSRGTSV